MLYLAIDQHRKQLTVNLRNEQGDVLVKRQVSTEWPRVRSFLEEVRKTSVPEGGFVAILEVCGFNDWLLKLLAEYGCRETILIQPEKRSKKKTDRRDANALGELLWVNRQRLLAGKKIQGIRRIQLPTDREAEDRQLTAVRQRLGQQRTRTINRIKHLLRKHNLEQTAAGQGARHDQRTRKWLAALPLGAIDRLEMDQLLGAVEAVGRADCEGGSWRSKSGKRRTRRRPCWRRFPAARPTAAWRWPRGSARSSGSRGRRVWRTTGA